MVFHLARLKDNYAEELDLILSTPLFLRYYEGYAFSFIDEVVEPLIFP